MSEPVRIAKISAVVNGGELSVESLTVRIGVNTVPTASIGVARKADTIVHAPISDEILAIIRQRQQTRLAGLREPDMLIEAFDGFGGSIEFRGFLSAPVIDVTTTSTADQLTVMGVDSILDALDLGVYQAGAVAARTENAATPGDGPKLEPIPSATTGQVTQLISDISTVLYNNYGTTLLKEEHPSMKALITQQHELNTGLPYDTWQQILKNSGVFYETWQAAMQQCPFMGPTMTERIKNMITQRGGGFWQTINQLMATFQMFYVPEPGKPGKLVRADSKVGEPTRTLELSATGVSLSDGSHRLLPVGGVVMMAPSAEEARPELGQPANRQTVAAAWPDPLLSGFIQREMPPMWLIGEKGRPILGTQIAANANNAGAPNYSIPDCLIRREVAAEQKFKMVNATNEVMKELCRVMFNEIQLAHSTAEATLPLDFMITVGERVTVKIAGGEGTFTAFVNSVAHSVDLRNGKELNSFTRVSLTHVRY